MKLPTRLPTLTQIAKGSANFDYYKDGVLYYTLLWDDGDDHPPGEIGSHLLEYIPIPVDDAGAGVFTPNMKGMNVLRWARKYVELIRQGLEIPRPLDIDSIPIYDAECEGKARKIGEGTYEAYLEGLETEDPQG